MNSEGSKSITSVKDYRNARKSKAKFALKHAIKETALINRMNNIIISEQIQKKPQFRITDEGLFRDGIVNFQSLTTASSIIGKIIGRSNQNVEMAQNKFFPPKLGHLDHPVARKISNGFKLGFHFW